MKFSFFMMPCHHPSENAALAFQRDIDLIHLADKLGFDEFYIGEHHSGGWETMPAPEMALAMAAANAHRIRLGTSVFSAPFHHRASAPGSFFSARDGRVAFRSRLVTDGAGTNLM